MASRMDRYYKSELVSSGRSTKNKNLYEKIQDLDSYTNIEGVATIEKTNEIDISRVQEMLKNRENYKKQKKYQELLVREDSTVEPIVEKEEEIKNYDINDMLEKAKEIKPMQNKNYRSLGEKEYNALKSLTVKGKNYDIDEEEEKLKELINTMTITRSLKNSINIDDVGLLDELKSDTMVGDASSIKKIIEEEKNVEQKENTMEIDKSFYTSSFGFTQSDFEELKDINRKLKKGNKFIIFLLVILIALIAAVIIYFITK